MALLQVAHPTLESLHFGQPTVTPAGNTIDNWPRILKVVEPSAGFGATGPGPATGAAAGTAGAAGAAGAAGTSSAGRIGGASGTGAAAAAGSGTAGEDGIGATGTGPLDEDGIDANEDSDIDAAGRLRAAAGLFRTVRLEDAAGLFLGKPSGPGGRDSSLVGAGLGKDIGASSSFNAATAGL